MKKRNMKKIFAVAMAGVMTLGNGLVVFADGSVTGNGVVEYDNSEAVAYDVIEVPTLNASTYNFTLDPTGQLHSLVPANYDAGTVYFSSIKDRAYIEAEQGVNLFKQSKKVKAQESGEEVWAGIVTLSDSTPKTIATVTDCFYVWIPKTVTGYSKGKSGEFVKLTTGNISKWFEIADETNSTIKLKSDYKSGVDVCDGIIYQDEYTPVTKITDSDTDPLDDYVTTSTDAQGVVTITAVNNLYKDNSGTKEAATASDITYTKAVSANQNTTNAVTVINKSTKNKTVTATVTMSNVGGITFRGTDFANPNTATDASMYVTVGNGTTNNALVASEDGTTATATFTAPIAAAHTKGKTTLDEVTYMGADSDTNTKTGGHNYYRYEAPNTEYESESFYITAKANDSAVAKDEWNKWAAGVVADKRPSFQIVYSVTDTPTTYTVTYDANYTGANPATKTESVNNGSHPTATGISFTREGYDLLGWNTDKDATTALANLNGVSSETTLYAIWKVKDVAPSITTTSYTLAADTAVVVNVDLGSGSLAADGEDITVKFNGTTLNTAMWSYDSDEKKVTFTAAYVNALLAKTDVNSRTHQIVFDDDDDSVVNITFNWGN